MQSNYTNPVNGSMVKTADVCEGSPLPRFAKGTCSRCGCRLSVYNKTNTCGPCRKTITTALSERTPWGAMPEGLGMFPPREPIGKVKSDHNSDL